MRNWAESDKLWQCDTCAITIVYEEICQAPTTGVVMCPECWVQWRTPEDGQIPPEPLLCGECGRGMLPLEHLTTSIVTGERYCATCVEEIPLDEFEQAVGGLLGILEDTNEEG